MKKIYTFIFAMILIGIFSISANAQIAVTVDNPTNTTPNLTASYTSLADAITALNSVNAMTGPVTFSLAAGGTETAPVGGFVLGSASLNAVTSATNTITFVKSGAGANPLITAFVGTSTSFDGIWKIQGTDYITIDGIDLQESAGNATATTQMEWGYALVKLQAVTPFDGCQYVTIQNCTITLRKANTASVGIYVGNHVATATTSLTITAATDAHNNNRFYTNTITNVYVGIRLAGFAASSPYTLYDQNNEIGNGAGTGNNITNFGGSSATAYGIYTIYQSGLLENYNTINGGSGTTTTLYGIFNSTSNNTNLTIRGNTVTIQGGATTSSIYAISNATGGTGTTNTLNIYDNTILNCTYTTATSGVLYLLYNSASAYNINIYNNVIRNNAKSGTSGSMYLLYNSNLGTNGNENIYNNNIYSNTCAGSGTLYILYSNSIATATKNIYGNNIYSITGGGSIQSLNQTLGTTVRVYNNKIYDINSTSALTTAGLIRGMVVGSGTNVYFYNNYISELKAPSSTGTDAIRGIDIASTSTLSTIGVYYNSIYLNASSSGANFGTSGIFHSASTTATTATLDMRNNIVVNNSTPSGTGITAAYRRSSTSLSNYGSNSNNNLFYAGTPSASRLIFYDGTNSDLYIADYKTRVVSRDVASFTELPPFVNIATSPYDLHLQTTVPTQCESGGTVISSPIAITTDYDGNVRNASTPDVGADEGGFTGLDLTAPTIFYTAFGNTSSTGNRTLTATITDLSGIPTSGPGLPVLYWKINAGAYTAATATFITGNTYEFSFGAGVVIGDVVSYYVAAQDLAGTPNVGVYPSAGATGFTANPPAASTPPTTPSSYTIAAAPLSGDYTVGILMFNKITGKNITFEKVTKKVMKEVEVEEPITEVKSNSKVKDKGDNSVDLVNGIDQTTAPLVKTRKVIKEIEEISYVPMENGKMYEGNLYIKKSENPNFNYPANVNGIYATITAAVADLNLRGVSGHTRFLLNDASYTTATSETFPITVNVLNDYMPSASATITIKPNTGVTSLVQGASASSQIFNIRSNYVTIDGSNAASGTSRDLTIENTSATSPQVIGIRSNGVTPITNMTVKNSILINGSNGSSALVVSDLAGGAGYFNNITVQNNSVQKAYIGIYYLGTVAVGNGSGTLITGNDMNTSGANSIRLIGVYVQGVDGATVTNNNIGNMANANAESPRAIVFATGTNSGTISGNNINGIAFTGTGAYAPTGIACSPGATATSISITNNTINNITNSVGTNLSFCGISSFSPNTNITNNTVSNLTQSAAYAFWGIVQSGAVNSSCSDNTVYGITTTTTGVANGINIQGVSTGVTISKNKIYNIKNTNSGGYTAVALALSSSSTTANITASNNIIYDIAGYGYASQTTDNGYGINIYSGGGYNLYYNSINMATNQTSATGAPACIIINSAVTTVNTLDIRNNIFSHPATVGTNRYAVLSNAANTVFSNINNNDYYTSGTNIGYIGAANITDLAAWKTATGKDANSVSGDPMFISTTDLHIQTSVTSPVNNAGTYIASVLTDYDGNTRNVTTPDIGADEYTYVPPSVEDPSGLTATATSSAQIDLAWTNNGANDNVLLVFNTTNTFGVPADGTPYAVTEEIPGGGFVIYSGTDGNFVHSGLNPNTAYYYKAFSFDGTTAYSPGITANATTLNALITVTPVSLAFGYTPSGGTSAEKTYTVTAANIIPASGNITITPPANFEISLTTGTGFTASPINIPYTGGALATTTIYAVFKPTATGTNYSNNITNAGGNATTKNVAVTGTSILSYCPSIPSNTADEEIFSVTVNGATNAYNCTTVAPGPGSILNRYSNFYPLGNLTNLSQGYTISFTILEDECDGATYYTNGCAIWIDYNQNGIFEEPGEKVFVETSLTSSPRTITGTFTVPASAPIGQTGMRIIVAENYSGTGLTPCMTYSYGETEDYYVNIIAPVGPPNPVSFSSTASSSSQIDLAFAPNASSNPVVIVWNATGTFTDPTGAPPSVGSPFAGGTLLYNGLTSPQNHTGLTSGTQYFYKAFSYDGMMYSGGLIANATTLCALSTLPFAQSFDAVTFPPSCWALINAGTGNQWVRSTSTPYAGLGVMVYNYNSSAAANAWSFTPGFNLQSGKTYRVGFQQKVASATYPEKMKVTVGLDQTVAAQTTTLWDNAGGTTLSNTTYMLRNADFTCTSTGTYYFAFNCYSDADMYNLFVDEVTIMEQPAIDLAFTQFYQNSGLPTPSLKSGEKFSDYNVTMSKPKIKESSKKTDKYGNAIKEVEHERQFLSFDKNMPGIKGLTGNNTKITPNNPKSYTDALGNINVRAQITNYGLNAATFLLDWNVSGTAQTQYSGSSVAPATSTLADLTYTPTSIGTFLTTGNITVTGDEVSSNNTAPPFRMRVYPETFTRTINDRGDNVIDTYVGWNSATTPMTAGVRYTSTDAVKLAGVDFICRAETVTSGTFTVKVRAAGTTTTAPGTVLYTKTYNTTDYIPNSSGEYIFFPFDDAAPTIAAATDYWITIEAPVGILYPGGAQSSGFVAGRSFYESTPGGDIWSALILSTVEYAWVMRSVNKPVSTLNLTAMLQGFYDGTTMVSDTVTVELRNSTSFALVDQSRTVLNTSGVGTALFTNVANATPYYIVIKHRNALETWSATAQTFTSYSLSYDFTSAVTQAYGSNMILVGTKWCLYVGDVSDGTTLGMQDGFIEIADMDAIYLDNVNFVEGWVVTDLNGDLFTEIGDMDIAYTNNVNFVEKMVPSGALDKNHIQKREIIKKKIEEFLKSKEQQGKYKQQKVNILNTKKDSKSPNNNN